MGWRVELSDKEKTRIRDEWRGSTEADLNKAIAYHMDTNLCPFTKERDLCGHTDCPFLDFASCPIVIGVFGDRTSKEVD